VLAKLRDAVAWQEDVFVARYNSSGVLGFSTFLGGNTQDHGEAIAVVTAQAGRITTDHIVIGTEPKSRWYRSPLLWMGTAFGLLAGFGLGRI
jgi:hypothetical protein